MGRSRLGSPRNSIGLPRDVKRFARSAAVPGALRRPQGPQSDDAAIIGKHVLAGAALSDAHDNAPVHQFGEFAKGLAF